MRMLEEYARRIRQAADDVWEIGKALGEKCGRRDLGHSAKMTADDLHALARKIEAEARKEEGEEYP